MKNVKKIAVMMLAVVMLITAIPFSAFAASNTPKKPSFSSFSSTTSSITVSWKKVSGAKGYVLYKYDAKKKKYSKIATTSKTNYKVSKLNAGTNYVYALKAYKTVKKKNYYSSYSSKLTATTLPAKPTGLKATSTYNSISLSWSKVRGASGYCVYKYDNSSKKYTKLATTSKTNYSVTKLNSGTNYVYAVKAYKTLNKKNYYSSYSSNLTVTTLPSNPTGLKATSTHNSVSLSWSKVNGASGYNVYSYNSSTKKYSYIANTSSTTYKINSLKEDTTYKYAVIAYKTVNKKNYNSSYSSVITVKTKVQTVSAPSKLSATNVTDSSATFSISKVSNAHQYMLEYSKNSDFSDSVRIVLDSSTIQKTIELNSKTDYFVRAFATRTVNGKIYTSSSTNVVRVSILGDYSSTLTKVDETKTYQTIDGFGASGCWWAQRVGRWNDEEALIERDPETESLWTPQQTRNALKYLYDKNYGIGLNIYRYNLGADSYNDTVITDKWRRTESFLEEVKEDGTLVYNWDKDKAAMNTLSVAKDLYGDDLRVTLFANSPPVQLTKNGNAYCDNLNVNYWAGQYDSVENQRYYLYDQNITGNRSYFLYAKYLTDIADHFVENGYNVVDVSPVNEPQTDWAYGIRTDGEKEMSQEGCHYTPKGMSELAAQCAVAGEGKPYKFSMFDSGAADGANENDLNCSSIKYIYKFFENGAKVYDLNNKPLSTTIDNRKCNYIRDINKYYYSSFSVHSYWADKNTKNEFSQYVQNKYPHIKSFACTEYCQMTNDVNTGVFDISSPIDWWKPERNGLGIEYGVHLARVMHDDLTTLNATEWDWWTGCSGGYYPDGLVYVDYQNPDNVQTSKRLWAMGNYSKFIQEGAVRVNIKEAQNELLSTAYKNPDGSLVIVYVNLPKETVLEYNVDEYGNRTPKTVLREEIDRTVNISALGYSDCSVYVTSDEYDLENTENSSYSINKFINIPGQSVVTVVLKK